MDLIIDPHGGVRCIYSEVIPLNSLGTPTIVRASHVEPDSSGRWWADITPVGGPQLGPFDRRSEAIDAELAWLEEHWLDSPTP